MESFISVRRRLVEYLIPETCQCLQRDVCTSPLASISLYLLVKIRFFINVISQGNLVKLGIFTKFSCSVFYFLFFFIFYFSLFLFLSVFCFALFCFVLYVYTKYAKIIVFILLRDKVVC